MKITKRNGTVHVYDDDKVVKSILNANSRVPDEEISPALAAALAEAVTSLFRHHIRKLHQFAHNI